MLTNTVACDVARGRSAARWWMRAMQSQRRFKQLVAHISKGRGVFIEELRNFGTTYPSSMQAQLDASFKQEAAQAAAWAY